MSAVTGFRRLSIIAIAALLAAGCGANTPTDGSTPSPAASIPSAAPTPYATPIAVVTAQPTSRCAPLSEAYEPNDDFEVASPLGGHYLAMDFTRVSSNDNPDEFVEFEAGAPYLDEPGRLVGGWQIGVYPGIDYEPVDEPIVLIAAEAVLRVPGRDGIPMEGSVAPDGKSFLFDLPDAKGSVVIDFIAEFSDACFTYRAEGAGAFEMVRAAQAAGCPTGHKGFAEHWAALGDDQLQVGDVGVEIINHQISGLWTPYFVAAQGGSALGSWDSAAPSATGEVGGIIRVAPTHPDLRINALSATYHRRGAVLDARPGDDPPRVFAATADPYPDGHLDLLVPSEPGRYVAALGVDWTSPCAYGGAFGGVSIDVE